jgi:hypothetical protein
MLCYKKNLTVWTDDIPGYFDLRQHHGLQSLFLNDVVICDRGGGKRIGYHIPVLLSQITSLEELTIYTVHPLHIKPEIWNSIDQQVDRLHFSNLRRLSIRLGPAHTARDIVFVTAKLPLCAQQGILRFL